MKGIFWVSLFLICFFYVTDSSQGIRSNRSPFLSDFAKLEKMALKNSFSNWLCKKEIKTTKSLYLGCDRYQELAKTIVKDIEEGRRPLEKALWVDSFQKSWLASSKTEFRLIGQVTRWDRMVQRREKGQDSCGEFRLIYRLVRSWQEREDQLESYLPMTAMVVLPILDSGSCKDKIAAFQKGKLSVEELLPEVEEFDLELNWLNQRVPAQYGGTSTDYSEYAMRVFHLKGEEELIPVLLENSPDVEKIKRSKILKQELKEWIEREENSKKIFMGAAILPKKFLAEVVKSVGPFGELREINAPFSQIFSEGEVDLKKIRRLNGMSCQGCHQVKSNAGFHFHGAELEKDFVFNKSFVPASAQFYSEQNWREAFVDYYLQNGEFLDRPWPERTWRKEGRAGDLCSNSQEMNCQEGMRCQHEWKSQSAELNRGYCQNIEMPIEGESCLAGAWISEGSFLSGLGEVKNNSCFGIADCLPQEIGFPGGLCVTDCDEMSEGAICQSVPELDRFSLCRESGKGLKECFETATQKTGLRACDLMTPCRPDYLCAKHSEEKGVCVPPYFLLQFNISGHHKM